MLAVMRTLIHPAPRLVPCAIGIAALCAAGCGSDSPVAPGGSPGDGGAVSVQVTVADILIFPGQTTTASAVALDASGAPIGGAAATFASSAPEVAVVNPTTGQIFAVAPGNTDITATVDGVTGRHALTVFQLRIRINEVTPGPGSSGWVELFNQAGGTADLSGWTLTAGNVFASVVLPPGTVIGGSSYLVIDESRFPDGIAADGDAVHLFSSYGVQVDSFSWATAPSASFARCPDGFGPFRDETRASRGAANPCPDAQ
jgi:hypothetical protein